MIKQVKIEENHKNPKIWYSATKIPIENRYFISIRNFNIYFFIIEPLRFTFYGES